MEVLFKALKNEEKKRARAEEDEKKEQEERKKLTTSMHELEKNSLYNEYKVKDTLKEVQTRELLLREKDRQIETLLPLFKKNEELVEQVKKLKESLMDEVRLKQALEQRLQRQVEELGRIHTKRIDDARSGAMNMINEHIQLLQLLFQKYITDPKQREECLAAFVTSADAIRTAVGIHL